MRCLTFLYSMQVAVCFPTVSLESTTMLAAFTVSSFFIFSGFLIPPKLIPDLPVWVLYVNPFYWASARS